MKIDPVIVSFVFRLLNFGMLIGVSLYVYKKYAHKLVQDGIAEKKRTMDGLHQEQDALNRYAAQLDNSLDAQGQKYQTLEQKIKTWSLFMVQESQARLDEKNDRIDELKKRNENRSRNIERQVVAKKVKTAAVEKAAGKIAHIMSGKSGHAYVDRICTYMKKSVLSQESK